MESIRLQPSAISIVGNIINAANGQWERKTINTWAGIESGMKSAIDYLAQQERRADRRGLSIVLRCVADDIPVETWAQVEHIMAIKWVPVDQQPGQYVVITGSPTSGFDLYGPFVDARRSDGVGGNRTLR